MSNPSTMSATWRRARERLPEALQDPTVRSLLCLSIAEDVAPDGEWKPGKNGAVEGDVTSTATIDAGQRVRGNLVAKQDGVIAGLPVARALFQLVDPDLTLTPVVEDSMSVGAGEQVASVAGPGRSLLTAERSALNVLGRLSGVATKTRRFVEAVSHTDASIVDTRKTSPGMRRLDKYAVRMGGGKNHRLGLYDMVLIKDNHIDATGSVSAAVSRARAAHGNEYPIQVEVKTLDELDEALAVAPDFILLDNMDVDTMRQAVDRTDGRVPLEASGNVTLETVQAVAETGVDRISVGALTHSASTLDLSLRAR